MASRWIAALEQGVTWHLRDGRWHRRLPRHEAKTRQKPISEFILSWLHRILTIRVAVEGVPMAERGPGWLYALQNPMHPPDLLKVGLSARAPAERAAELSAGTGVPLPYTVADAVYVLDCGLAEGRIHALLRHCRVTPIREFFRISLADYRLAVERMLRDAPELVARMAPDAPANANLPAPPLRSHEFKGTPTWVTVDTKKKVEPRPNGRPWVPPWIKQ